MLVQLGADILHVAGLPNKGSGNKVEVVLGSKLQVILVLLGEGGEHDAHIGDVDGLVIGQGAAVLHGAVDVVAFHLLHQQLDQTVIHQDAAAGAHFFMQI